MSKSFDELFDELSKMYEEYFGADDSESETDKKNNSSDLTGKNEVDVKVSIPIVENGAEVRCVRNDESFGFQVKTKGDTNPNGKSRVFFSCHPDDFDNSFVKICEDIFSTQDCAVYYTEKMAAKIPDDTRETDLGRMNLFVIPVTLRLLTQPNRAMDSDFQFAQEKHIPVLPIMMENGLTELFNRPDKFGPLQYLNPYSTDLTEIGYKEKLKKYLESVLISDDMARRIRKAFDAYIFLSYRKKDRRLANEFMRLIHSRTELQDIAVWYDEFLTPGESYRENIDRMLHNSKLFALLITPNLLEEPDGKPNYVMAVEYPEAKNISDLTGMLPILPAEMIDEGTAESVDKTALQIKFPGLPECVKTNSDEFLPNLIDTLNRLVERGNDSDPMHNYLVGLAYLGGIDVEVDRDKAHKLISFAAENGVIDAARKLVEMYYYGVSYNRDFTAADYWQQKLVSLLQEKYNKEPTAIVAFDLADALRFLTEIERNISADDQNIDEMISYCKRALDICTNTCLSDDESKSRFIECELNTLRSLAILYEMAEDYDNALKSYNKSLEMRKMIIEADKDIDDAQTKIGNEWRMAQLYHDIGIMYRKKGDYKSSVSELLKSVEIFRSLSKDTSELLQNEAYVHGELAYVATFVDVSLAEKHSKMEIDICRELIKENISLYELNYANALFNRAFVLTELGSSDYDEMEELCEQAKEIYERHINTASYETNVNYINVLYKLAAINAKKYLLDKAGYYYEKAVNTATELISVSSSEFRLTLAHLYFDYGSYLTFEPNRERLNKAIQYLKKALSLFENTGREGLKYIDETKRVISVIETEMNNNVEGKYESDQDADIEVKKAFFNFQHFLEKGDEAEKSGNYQKACLSYKASLDQLLILEKTNANVDRLGKAGVLDRLAYCCEMSQDLTGAESYYAQAAELAAAEALETFGIRAIEASGSYYNKIISFLDDYGRKDEAEIYRKKLFDLKESLLAKEKTDDPLDKTAEDEHIIELPDRNGNRTPYKLLGVVEYKHKQYALFVKQSLTVVSRDNVLLINIKESRNGENSFSLVTKSSLIDKVYEIFKNHNKGRFTFTD